MRITINLESFELFVDPKVAVLIIIAWLCTLMFMTLIAMIAPELLGGDDE